MGVFAAGDSFAITSFMIKAVFFDMDDTLIVNEVLYDHARASLVGYMRHFGVKADEVHATIDSIDAVSFKTLGTSRFRYPQTYENVLKHFIPNADVEMISIVRGFAEEVFSTIAPVKPGTLDALELLHGKFDLYIMTAGDEAVQQKRLSHLPFLDLFKDVYVVEKKDIPTFEDCVKRSGHAPKDIVMVGDSLKSDVIPAVAVGMQAVLIEAKTSASFHPLHHGAGAIPDENAYVVSSLMEFARHMAEHGHPASTKFKPVAPKAPKI